MRLKIDKIFFKEEQEFLQLQCVNWFKGISISPINEKIPSQVKYSTNKKKEKIKVKAVSGFMGKDTACPRSLVHFHIISMLLKWTSPLGHTVSRNFRSGLCQSGPGSETVGTAPSRERTLRRENLKVFCCLRSQVSYCPFHNLFFIWTKYYSTCIDLDILVKVLI